YRLAVDPDAADVHRFTTLAAAGHRELTAGQPAAAAATLTGALALWRGAPLAGLDDAPFAPAAAARLAEARLAAAEDHAEAALSTGQHAEIIGGLEALAEGHPLRERLRGLLVRALYACGRQADALAAYQRTRQALADQLGVDPSPELRAVHLAVLRQDRALLAPATPSPAPAGRPATNLRAQLTSFVGRDTEMARIGTLLAEARLVTLVGPGGAGKTRLATESAARLDRPPADGVWLVELAPVADPADLPHAVADALGVRETALLAGRRDPVPVGPADPTDVLVRALAGRALLVVLDNCEHLVDAAARLVDALLAGCPQVRVLATSREPLGITGEMLYPVPPLVGPPEHTDAAGAAEYPAVRLLADRGAAASPGFAVHEGNVAAVARVCQRLDGMPLAIELAAARLRALPVEQVAARLDDRFRLLTAGSRTALPRHQTLRAVVEWSWDLLDKRERVLARRLSAFPAGADLDAAERVCASGGLPADDVFEVLAALVDKSLVEVDGTDGGPPRYRMLETVRAFAAERLAASGEEQRVREAHAHYYRDLAEVADPGLRGRDQLDWIRRLVAEQENLHAALRWAVDTPDPELAVRLAAGLAWFWMLRGHHGETVTWARQIVAAVGDSPPAGYLGSYVGCRLGATVDFIDMSVLTAELDAGMRLLAEAGEPEPRNPAFMLIRLISAMLAGQDGVITALLDAWAGDPDPWVRACAAFSQGHLRLNDGDAGSAGAYVEAGLAGYRAIGERWGMCQCLMTLAELAGYTGDNARSVALLEEAGRLVEELGASGEVPEVLVRLAAARLRAGDRAGAGADVAEARRWSDRWAQPHVRAFVSLAEGELAWRDGDVPRAEERYERALAAFDRAGGPPQFRAMVHCARARILLGRGELGPAAELVCEPLRDPGVQRDRPVVAGVLETLAAVADAGGDAERAAVLLGAAESARGTADLGNPDIQRVDAAARRALGEPGHTLARQRGAALNPPELSDLIGVDLVSLRPSGGRPARPAARTPR
ncbi:MAG TPA: BTAD domain-containing putative transcriptional regulator, partial [Mycobacteriales bacterium]|nr:BTAD domain-containing putative transcriptional regulator [Mycobacteriales bacterium]